MDTTPERNDRFAYWTSVDFGLAAVADQRARKFQTVKLAGLRAIVRQASEYYIGQFFAPAASPLNAAGLQTRCFTAREEDQSDLIEYHWTYEGLRLRYVENINAAKLAVPLVTLAGGKVDVTSMKETVFRLVNLEGDTPMFAVDTQQFVPYRISLPWPETLANGAQFSSDSSRIPHNMTWWTERVDAAVEAGHLQLIFYKRPYHSPHPLFLPGHGWLSGAVPLN